MSGKPWLNDEWKVDTSSITPLDSPLVSFSSSSSLFCCDNYSVKIWRWFLVPGEKFHQSARSYQRLQTIFSSISSLSPLSLLYSWNLIIFGKSWNFLSSIGSGITFFSFAIFSSFSNGHFLFFEILFFSLLESIS